MRKVLRTLLILVPIVAIAVYLNNSNLFATRLTGKPVFLAHRGIAQQFDTTDLRNDTCTGGPHVAAHPWLS